MQQFATVVLDSSNAILVLMLVSLGLAIIFGLMNVINMAHGEFLMLGCYAIMELVGSVCHSSRPWRWRPSSSPPSG